MIRTLLVSLFLVPSLVWGVDEDTKSKQVRLDSLLIVAVWDAQLDSVKSLLRQGAEPSAKGGSGITAFQYASEKCNLDVMTVMRGGAQAAHEIQKSKLSMWGSGRIYDEIVLVMLARGIEPHEPPVKPGDDKSLLQAAIYGHADRIPALLEAGANVNAQSKGRSALMWAAFWGHTGAVKMLLEGGANTELRDATGNTALFWAKQLGHREVADLIKEEVKRRRTAQRDSSAPVESGRTR